MRKQEHAFSRRRTLGIITSLVLRRRLAGGAVIMLLIYVLLVDGSLPKNVPAIGVVESIGASAPDGLEGAFEKVWVEHNVKEDGINGMRIHAKFSVKNGLNVDCLLLASFFTRDGAPLRGVPTPSQYKTAGGDVAAWTRFKPRYISSEYADKKIFVPYSALNLQSGVHNLKFFLVLRGQGKDFVKSAWYNFRLTKD